MMENANFVKTDKRRPKSTKRKKPGEQDVCGNSIIREVAMKTEPAMSGVKNETDPTDNWNVWPCNGHVDHPAPDVKSCHDELNTSSTITGNDSVGSTLPSIASSTVPEALADQVAGVNTRPTGVFLDSPTCVLPGPRMSVQNRGFVHRPMMGNLENHFLPQQSQIFVFSTSLANEAAEALQSGRCRSILDFHLDHPATKQFLQAFPVDAPLFQGGHMPSYADGNKLIQKEPLPFMESDSALANVELWVQQQNASLQEGPFSPSFGPSGKQSRSKSGNGGHQRWMPSPNRGPMGSSIGDFMGQGGEQMLGPPGYMTDGQMPRGGMPPGQNVEENLTPEQLQRREEQLAQLQKIKNMLFPEKRNEFDPRRPQGMYPGPPPRPGPEMMGFPRFPHPNLMPVQPPGMMEPPDGMMGLPMEPGFFGQPALPPNWENMTPEEREWFKLQHEYYLERQKSQIQMGGGSGFFNDLPPRLPGPMSPMSPSFSGSGPPNAQGFFYQGPPGMNFPPNGHGPEFHPDFIPGMGEAVFPFDSSGPVRINQGGHDATPVGMGPFVPGARFPNVCKQKRRRNMGDKTDDIYRHLQPAPSPQQFCSLNLFEGQELTITRQLNLAYQEPGYPSPSQSTPTQPRKKKKGEPGKQKLDEQKQNKGDLPPTPELFSSASSLLSPLPPTNVSTPNTNTTTPKLTLSPAGVEPNVGSMTMDAMTSLAPGTSANVSGALDTKHQFQTDRVSSAGCSNSSSTSIASSTNSHSRNPTVLSNITSATLASLAKGIESLSDRMQMDMKQGGPFRTVQMPENELELSGDSSSGGNLVSLPGSTASIKVETVGNKTPQLSLDGCLPSRITNCELSTGSNPEGLVNSDGNCSDEVKESQVSDGSTQLQDSSGCHMSSEGLEVPSSNKFSPVDGSVVPMCNTKRSSPVSLQKTSVTSMLSPNIIGNANIQIEARAPNTIQYLPALPCGPGHDGTEDPASSCVTMPFDSTQLMREGSLQLGAAGSSNPAGPPPGYGGPMHGYEGPPSGPGGMMHGYDGSVHGSAGPMTEFDGSMLMRNGPMPGFDVPMHGQGRFGPSFDSPVHVGSSSMPVYSDGPIHGACGPMSSFDGSMSSQVGSVPGYSSNSTPMPGYVGPPLHGPGCSMSGFDGQCGSVSDFDISVHGHGGPVGPGCHPHMAGFNGPLPVFSGSLPSRHSGSIPNHCGEGPMSGCHGPPPPMMNLPPNHHMFMPGRGPMMPASGAVTGGESLMPANTEGQRPKPESSGMTRKEKDRKKRSEAAKKNSGSVSGISFMEGTARDNRRINMDSMGALGSGSGRIRAGTSMLRMGPVEGGMGPGFLGMGTMEGRMRPGMMPMGHMDGGMRPGMMGMGQVDGNIRPGMMGMVPMDGRGMGPGIIGMLHDEASMRSGMMGLECESAMRPGMMGMGHMDDGMRPGMMGMGPLDGGSRSGMMVMGPMDGRPGMMGMEGGMRPEMMSLHPADGNMIADHSIMGMGVRDPGISVGPPESAMSSTSRMMSMGSDGTVRPGSNAMVMSPEGNNMRPSSRALVNSDLRSRQGSAPSFSSELGASRPDDGLIAPSPRAEDNRPDMMMIMGSGAEGGNKRMVQSAGSGDAGIRPGSGLMTSMDHGEPSNIRPGSRSISERMMLGMGAPAESGMRPGSALMMGMGHGDPSGIRPGSAMMMAIGGPAEGGSGSMRSGPAVMMGVGPDGMRLGPGMMVTMGPGENGMRCNTEVFGMGPGTMRPGSRLMMGIGVGGPSDDPMRISSEMMSVGPGDGRMRLGSEMVGMGPRMAGMGVSGRMVEVGFGDMRLGSDGGGGGGMMGMSHRVGTMMDMRNGGIFLNSSTVGGDPSRRTSGLEAERFCMAPGSMGDETFSAQFQQFQQQLYAKNHSQQPSPTMEMRGLPPVSMGFDIMRNGPNFGPHGGNLVHGGPPMGMGR